MGATRSSAIYAVCVGALMLAMWLAFIITDQVPEFTERPAEIGFHLAAEFATALLLIVGGIAALRRFRRGGLLLVFALGMLMYTLIVSPGYYVQRGEVPFILLFAALFLFTVAFTLLAIRRFGGPGADGQRRAS